MRGAKGGIGVMDEGLIDVLTPDGVLTVSQAREKYGNAQFDVFRGTMKKGLLPKLMPLLPFLQHRPKVDLKKCIGCGVCQEACPVPEKAVHSGHGKKAKYDYKKCIRCYCCQEMCPAKAISVYRSPLINCWVENKSHLTQGEGKSDQVWLQKKGQEGTSSLFVCPLRGQGAELPCGVWGNAPTVFRALNSKGTVNKGAGSEASLPVTSRVRRRASKAAFPNICAVSRQMGATM